MPVRKCRKNGKPGYKWGDQKCYTYEPGDPKAKARAKKKAKEQGEAIRASGYSG